MQIKILNFLSKFLNIQTLEYTTLIPIKHFKSFINIILNKKFHRFIICKNFDKTK